MDTSYRSVTVTWTLWISLIIMALTQVWTSTQKWDTCKMASPDRSGPMGTATTLDVTVADPGMVSVWTAWSRWSACTTTCGQGSRMRHRDCVGEVRGRLVRLEKQTCHGEKVEHVTCTDRSCAAGSISSRDHQCSQHDREEVFGHQYTWSASYGGEAPCELQCMAESHTFYYKFGNVSNGTPCHRNSPDVCLNGQCLPVGCDKRIGSNATLDNCRVCGGKNVNCVHYTNTYDSAFPESGDFGYTEVTKLPKGITYLRVHENSPNYLALADSRRTYVLNGNWIIDWPDTYNIAGTVIQYNRTSTNEEYLTASGPTQEDLYLMLIFRDKNNGIKYEYYINGDKFWEIFRYEDDLIQQRFRSAKNKIHPHLAYNKQLQGSSSSSMETDDDGHYPGNRGNSNHGYKPSYQGDSRHHNRASPTTRPTQVTHRPSIQNIEETHLIGREQSSGGHVAGARDTTGGHAHRHKHSQVGGKQSLNQPETFYIDSSSVNALIKSSSERKGKHRKNKAKNEVLPSESKTTDTASTTKSHQRARPAHKSRGVWKKQRSRQRASHTPRLRCSKCAKSSNLLKRYCNAHFVVRGEVMSSRRVENMTRYELRVVQSFKSKFQLMEREYFWVIGDECACPRPRRDKEYLVSASLRVMSGSRESRLVLSPGDLARHYTKDTAKKLRRVREQDHIHNKCEKIKARV